MPIATPQKCSLFVGDLSIFCTEQDLVDSFSCFGSVIEAKVMRCEETSKNLCYGFIKFSTPNAALKAMHEMNGKLLHGRPLRISWASHKARKGALPISISDSHGNNSSSIHVTYSSNQIVSLIKEDSLRAVFSKYGEVLDITVKKFEIDKTACIQRGYGFVHFPPNVSGMLSALKCTEEMKDVTIEDAHFKCEISHKLIKQLLNQQDPEVIKLVEKYFPLGVSHDGKMRDENKMKQTSVSNDYAAANSQGNETIQSNLILDERQVPIFFYGNGSDNSQFSVSHLPLPLPPFYSNYPVYPMESSNSFENRFSNYPAYFTLPLSAGVDSSDCETVPILSDVKGDSDSGDSTATNVYSYHEMQTNAMSQQCTASLWSSRSQADSVYSTSPWPLNSFVYPYVTVPLNAAFASLPYFIPSLPAQCTLGFQDNQFSSSPAFPGSFPFVIANQSKVSKTK